MTDLRTDTSKADAAKGAAQEVAATAAEQARGVASVASEQAATVGSQAVDQARTVLDSATGDVRDQLEQRLRTLSEQARTTAGELQALVEGRPDEAGRTKELAQTASQRIEKVADRVDELGIQGVVEEVSDLARRRPVLFLAGAATAGLLVGRMARAGREAQSETATSAPVTAPSYEPVPPAAFDPAPLPPPPPAPLPPPAAPGMDPGGSASGWVGS